MKLDIKGKKPGGVGQSKEQLRAKWKSERGSSTKFLGVHVEWNEQYASKLSFQEQNRKTEMWYLRISNFCCIMILMNDPYFKILIF